MINTNIRSYQNDFTQTFGKASKQLTSLSNTQRNEFDSLTIQQDKTQYFMPSEKSKNGLNFKSKNNYESRASQASRQQLRKDNSKMQLQHIDKINDKISGLIKSISASCHKPISKSQHKIQQEQNKKPNRNKQKLFNDNCNFNLHDNHELLNNKIKFKSDVQKTQKKMNSIQCSQAQFDKYLRPSLFDGGKRKSNSKDFNKMKEVSFGTQDYDQMSLRIKKINDKINNYELRIIGNQSKKANPIHTVTLNTHQNLQFPNPLTEICNIQNHHKQSQKAIPQNAHKNMYTNAIMRSQTMASKTLKYKQQINMKLNNKNISNQIRMNNIKSFQNKETKKNVIQNKQNIFDQPHLHSKHSHLQMRVQNKASSSKEENKGSNVTKIRTIDNENKHNLGITDYKARGKVYQIKDNIVDKSPLHNRLKLEQLSYKPIFLKNLVKQVELDQNFRHTKYMFGGIQDLQQQQSEFDSLQNVKWTNLQRQLQRQGFKLSMNEVMEIFIPKDDEIDPFMSVSHSHEQLIHGLIFAYQSCQRYWNENILRNQTAWQLNECNFIEQKIDRGKKGYISLQDLTFYINTQIDGNYRNRDLLLIWQRFSAKWRHHKDNEGGITFAAILQCLLSF